MRTERSLQPSATAMAWGVGDTAADKIVEPEARLGDPVYETGSGLDPHRPRRRWPFVAFSADDLAPTTARSG